MSNIRFYKTVIILLVILNLGTLVFIWLNRPGMQSNHVRREPSEFLIRELRLTPRQKEQFGNLRHNHLEQLQLLRNEDQKLHDSFFDALFLPVPDTLKANLLADSLMLIRKEVEMLTFRHFLELQKFLNDNQKTRFRKIFRNALDQVMPPPPPGPPPPPPVPPQQ